MSATESLPWGSLTLTQPEIPWTDLQLLADAAASDAIARGRLLDELQHHQNRCYEDISGYQQHVDLGVLAVIALAAERLSDAGRREAAESLLHALYRAGEAGDETMLEAIPAAAGLLGTAVIGPSLRLIESHGPEMTCWFEAFGLLDMVPKADDETKSRVRAVCRRLVREMDDRLERWSCAQRPARVLAKLRDTASLPALEEMERHAGDTEIKDIIEEMKSAADSTKWVFPEPWDTPVTEWLPRRVAEAREWLAKNKDESSEDDDEATGEPDPSEVSAVELYGDLVAEFVESPECQALPEAVREYAGFAAQCLLANGWDNLGVRVEKLSPRHMPEILVELFPRKISAESDFYEAVPAALKTFLTWLGARGRVADAAALCRAVDEHAPQMQARAADPRSWGMGKSVAMTAQRAGVDMSNDKEMQAFMNLYNAGIFPPADPNRKPRPEAEEWSQPIRNDRPRCGRNDPCPCGSGRKYKKCCGSGK